MNTILEVTLTDEMKGKYDRQFTPASRVFQKIVETKLVNKILETSIFCAKDIFKVDTESGTQIKSLDEPALFKQTVNLLGKGLMTNIGCY